MVPSASGGGGQNGNAASSIYLGAQPVGISGADVNPSGLRFVTRRTGSRKAGRIRSRQFPCHGRTGSFGKSASAWVFVGGLLPDEHQPGDLFARNLGHPAQGTHLPCCVRDLWRKCAGAVSFVGLWTQRELSRKLRTTNPLSEAGSSICSISYATGRPLSGRTGRSPVSPWRVAQNKLALYKGKEGFALPLNESPSTQTSFKPLEIEAFSRILVEE